MSRIACLHSFPRSLILSSSVVPMLTSTESVNKLLTDCLPDMVGTNDFNAMSQLMINQLGSVGCKTALRLVEKAAFASDDNESATDVLALILEDIAGDNVAARTLCDVVY